MFDCRHILWLIIFGSNEPSLVLVVPLVLEVDIFTFRIRQSSTQTVEDRGPGTNVPLLDHAGVDVDVLVASDKLPDLKTITIII